MRLRIVIMAACLLVGTMQLWAGDGKELQRSMVVLGGQVVYSWFDVLNYPTWGKDNIVAYRALQHAVLIADAYVVYRLGGWSALIAFAINHLTWQNDFLFYLWYEMIYPKSRAFYYDVLRPPPYEGPAWAGWTLLGVGRGLFTGDWQSGIRGELLIAQGMIGVKLGFSIAIMNPVH